MLMGAAHDALWAFNARVSLTLPCVIARKLPRLLCGLVLFARPLQWSRPADLKRGHGAPTYGSAQTGMYPFALYCGVGLPTGFLCQGAEHTMRKGERTAVI